MLYLGVYGTDEDAARVYDFAVLSVRGVGGKRVILNFDVCAYLDAGGALLPVEAALLGLGRDKHTLVRDKLATAVAGAGGTAEGAAEEEDGCDSGSESDRAGPASPRTPALWPLLWARRRPHAGAGRQLLVGHPTGTARPRRARCSRARHLGCRHCHRCHHHCRDGSRSSEHSTSCHSRRSSH
jgi:hypothetical protein